LILAVYLCYVFTPLRHRPPPLKPLHRQPRWRRLPAAMHPRAQPHPILRPLRRPRAPDFSSSRHRASAPRLTSGQADNIYSTFTFRSFYRVRQSLIG
jgi:hypothetical protein